MASYPRRKSESGSTRDIISQLPANVNERIVECLPIRDAARTSLLSTHWRNVWLGHGRLVFDFDFFWCIQKCQGDKAVAVVKIITNILLHRVGPVKKFILHTALSLEQSDLDQWFLYLSRNGVEELSVDISVLVGHKYKLPSCIISCPTIKQLRLYGFYFQCPGNARFMFPGVTCLVFKNVEFKSNNGDGIVYSMPNLEKLAFHRCKGISNFKINAPKLEILSALLYAVKSRWFTPHLIAIKTLCLSGVSLLLCGNVEIAALPTAINLQVIKLYFLSFARGKELAVAMQLLQNSPILRELEIIASNITCSSSHDIKATSRLLEDPDNVNRDLKLLKTIKIESFRGSTLQMLFVKMLLSKSPALEKIVIQDSDNMNASMLIKVQRELLRFPRASTKAQIICREWKPTFSLVDYPHF